MYHFEQVRRRCVPAAKVNLAFTSLLFNASLVCIRCHAAAPVASHETVSDSLLVQMAHKVTRALVSVSDKTGLTDLCRLLTESYKVPFCSEWIPLHLNFYQVEILSTGGTAKALRDAGIAGMLIMAVSKERCMQAKDGKLTHAQHSSRSERLYRLSRDARWSR